MTSAPYHARHVCLTNTAVDQHGGEGLCAQSKSSEGVGTMHIGLRLTSHEEQEALEQFHAAGLLPAGR
jgi:hypothetical protein